MIPVAYKQKQYNAVAHERIDVVKIFELLNEHKKVLIRASRNSDKGDFVRQFHQIGDGPRNWYMNLNADTKAYFKERDDWYHKNGFVAIYTCEPRPLLGEFVQAGERFDKRYYPETHSAKGMLRNELVANNTRVLVIDTRREGVRDPLFFLENGFFMTEAPLL